MGSFSRASLLCSTIIIYLFTLIKYTIYRYNYCQTEIQRSYFLLSFISFPISFSFHYPTESNSLTRDYWVAKRIAHSYEQAHINYATDREHFPKAIVCLLRYSTNCVGHKLWQPGKWVQLVRRKSACQWV